MVELCIISSAYSVPNASRVRRRRRRRPAPADVARALVEAAIEPLSDRENGMTKDGRFPRRRAALTWERTS
jgi:hypothetical protein